MCIDSALAYTNIYDTSRRSPKYRKLRNYNLYNGKFDKEDLSYVCNPLGIDGYEFPANMQYYPVATPIFDLLFGEEVKRPFSFLVKAVNPESITRKEKAMKDEIIQAIKMKILATISPEEAQQMQQAGEEPEEIMKYYKYSYQDMRESTATKSLEYLKRDLELKEIFQYGWEDALLAGEEIYKVGVVAGEPMVKRANPIEITALLPHNKYKLDDAEVIVEETWLSVSEIVDMFYDELTPAQIDDLEDSENSMGEFHASDLVLPARAYLEEEKAPMTYNYSFYDSDGNVRVHFVTWKSKKKVGELKYIDEYGLEQSRFVDETYKKLPGEKVRWFWINEYWEGVKIGADIYLGIKPKELQFRRMDNISVCKSGYVGTVYNANNSQSVSLMDRLVPWIYLYIVMWYRTELLIAANQGKIALIDLSLVPDGWEIEKWLYYATAMKFGFVNSFNEGKKGQSTGKLAGNISTQNKALDLETGNAINGHIQLIEFIENKIKELAGVTDQRLGAISASETVGNTKRAVTQSSHITEKWFQLHNQTKKRVLETLVEAAKEAWKDGSKKLQYISDDMSTTFFSLDGAEFNNAEYGVFISDSDKDREALEVMKELTHAAMQNDRIMLSSIADIYTSDSLSDVKAKLMEVEENMQQRQEQAAQQAQELEAAKSQAENYIKEKEIEKDYYKIDQDNATKLAVAEINSFKFQEDQDVNDNNVPDQLEIAKLKMNQDFNDRKLDIEERKLDLQDKKIKQDAKKNKADSKKKK